MQLKMGLFLCISFTDSLFLMYRKRTDFCMLILYPETLRIGKFLAILSLIKLSAPFSASLSSLFSFWDSSSV